MTVQDFIKKLGGVGEVSSTLNVPPTTIYSWQQHNRVPHWRIPQLAGIAHGKGLTVPASFAERAA